MATQTDNYEFTKPSPGEIVDINVLNDNFDKIDTALQGAVAIAGERDNRFGVNLSGLQWTQQIVHNATVNTGVPSDFSNGLTTGLFFVTSQADFNYFVSHGITLFRLGFTWDRMQPTLNGALDATYLGYLQTMVARAKAAGDLYGKKVRVILDCHNYGGRYIPVTITDAVITAGSDIITSPSNPFVSNMNINQVWDAGDTLIPQNTTVVYNSANQIRMKRAQTNSVNALGSSAAATITVYQEYQIDANPTVLNSYHLADFWCRMANVFKGDDTVWGYDIMNEPFNLPVRSGYPAQESYTLTKMMQIVINAIRSVDMDTWIATAHMNSGFDFVGYYGVNPSPWWNDPAGKVMISPHYYLDADTNNVNGGGSSFNLPWTQNSFNRIEGQITPGLSWGKRWGVPVWFGECGTAARVISGMAAGDYARYLTNWAEFLRVVDKYDGYITQWSAGSFYFSPTSMQPTLNHNGSEPTDYTDVPDQLVEMKKYPGKYVVPASQGGSSEAGMKSSRIGKQQFLQVQGRHPGWDQTDWTHGLILRPEGTNGFDIEAFLGRWLSFKSISDKTGATEVGRIDFSNGTMWFPPIHIETVTGPLWRRNSDTQLSARSGTSTSTKIPVEMVTVLPTSTSTTYTTGSLSLDCVSTGMHVVTAQANIASLNMINCVANGLYELQILQDATGSRTVTAWNAAFKFAGGVAPTLTTTANRRDIFNFRYFGGALLEVSRSMNVG